MLQSTKRPGDAGPWLLIGGLILGAGLLVFMTWDGMNQSKDGARHSEHVVALSEANWEKNVLGTDLPVVVDFSASWCGPCRRFAPTLDKIAERYKGRVRVGTLDVGDHSFDKAQKLQAQYGFSGIPHILIFKRGELRQQIPGDQLSEAVLARAIDKVLQ
jgi:thioredoxin 1